MSTSPGGQAVVFVVPAVAVVGAIVWLVLVAFGFSAFAKARNPSPGVANTALPVSKLAFAAAAVSLGSAFLGPFVVIGQIVGMVLAGLALREDPNPPSRTLAVWVMRWGGAMLGVVGVVAAISAVVFL